MKAFSEKLAQVAGNYDKHKLALKNKSTRGIVNVLRYAFLIGMSFVMVYPVLFILSAAFKNIQDVYDPTVVWLPKNFSLEPLKLALEVLDFENSIMRTLSVTLPSVFLQLISSLLAGYGFAKCNFPGKNVLFFTLIMLMIMPLQVTLVPNYIVLDEMGLLDTYYADRAAAERMRVKGHDLLRVLTSATERVTRSCKTGISTKASTEVSRMLRKMRFVKPCHLRSGNPRRAQSQSYGCTDPVWCAASAHAHPPCGCRRRRPCPRCAPAAARG